MEAKISRSCFFKINIVSNIFQTTPYMIFSMVMTNQNVCLCVCVGGGGGGGF